MGLIISQDLPDHKFETLYECDSLLEHTFIGRQTLLILPCEILFPIGREGLRCYLCCNWSSLTHSNPRYLYYMIWYSFIHPRAASQQTLTTLQQKSPCVRIHFLLLQHNLQQDRKRKKKKLFFSSNVLNIQICHGALKEKDLDEKPQCVLNQYQIPLRSWCLTCREMQYSQRWMNFSNIFRVKYELCEWFIKKKVDKYGCRVQHRQFKLSWGSCDIKPIECLYCTKISQVPVPLSCRWMGDPRSGSGALCCTHNPRSQLEAHAHHHISLLVQKNGKERFPAHKEPGNVQLGRGVKLKPWTQVMGSAAKEETVHRGGITETYRFDPLNKHLFVKFTNSHEPRGHLLRVCLFVHLHSQHWPDHLPARAAPQVTSRAAFPVEQKSAPKSGPAHYPYTFTPVKVPCWKNSERSRHARGKYTLKYLLQGTGFSAEQDIIKS